MTILAIEADGTLSLPASLRQKLGLKRRAKALVEAEVRNGGVFLKAVPEPKPRSFSVAQMKQWIADDEAGMKKLKGS